jgi:hypothetical protein
MTRHPLRRGYRAGDVLGGLVKLTAVELRRISLPLVAPFRTSFGT